jgi:CRISPR/Cas system-associated exonuclease Cas4 (RecB family)
MRLPTDFHFSQGSLQDYVDCQRRFQLRHLLHLSWPAIPAEPIEENERRGRMGRIFHQLINQHLLGLPQERLASIANAEDLADWWSSYIEHAADLKALLLQEGSQDATTFKLHPEFMFSAPLGDYRLVAKYDLIAVLLGKHAFIVDWKTSRNPPSWQWLDQRLQTRVYPYLLVAAGAQLNASLAIQPGQIEMLYWYAEQPELLRRFIYSSEKYQEDGHYLESLIAEIESKGEGDFTLTSERKKCNYCIYRSYCDRGVQAGTLGESSYELEDEADIEISLNFEQIAEIEF